MVQTSIKQAIRTLTNSVKDIQNQLKVQATSQNVGMATPKMLEAHTPTWKPDGIDIFELDPGYYQITSPKNGPKSIGGGGLTFVRITGYLNRMNYEVQIPSSNRFFILDKYDGSQLMPKLWQELHPEAILWRGSVYKKGSTITLLDSLQNYSKCKIQFNMFGNLEERTFYSPVSSDANQFNNTIVPSQMSMIAFNNANSIPSTNTLNMFEYSLQCNSDKTSLTLNYINPHTLNLDNATTNNDDFADAVQVMTVIGVR